MPAPHPADAAFLAVLPVVCRHAQIQFRFVRCPHARDDLYQEALAYSLKWTRLLWSRGTDARDFPGALATYAVLAVRNGRRLCGMCPAKDALNPAAQARFGFTCEGLPAREPAVGNPLAAALACNTRSAVPAQVAFRIDFPAWLATRSARDRAIICALMCSVRTQDLAARYQLSPARVSQLRREFLASWLLFVGDA